MGLLRMGLYHHPYFGLLVCPLQATGDSELQNASLMVHTIIFRNRIDTRMPAVIASIRYGQVRFPHRRRSLWRTNSRARLVFTNAVYVYKKRVRCGAKARPRERLNDCMPIDIAGPSCQLVGWVWVNVEGSSYLAYTCVPESHTRWS